MPLQGRKNYGVPEKRCSAAYLLLAIAVGYSVCSGRAQSGVLHASELTVAADAATGEATESSSADVLRETAETAELAEETLAEDAAVRAAEEHAATRENVSELPPTEAKASILKRLSQYFSGEEDFTEARKTALAIDASQLEDRAGTLVLLARAEQTANRPQQAWWSLHEAQQLALQLDDAEAMVGVFREIGRVETLLRKTPNTGGLVPLEHSADETIRTVLETGLPPRGYREIDILREGGGPYRDPMVIRHTYYFNGKRCYQGPRLGGPTIVKVTHPVNGCPACVSMNMPSGAPIIEHQERCIRYHFPTVCAEIEFKRSGECRVEYHHWMNNYRSLQAKLARGTPRPMPTGIQTSNTTAEAMSGVAKAVAGPPLNVAGRLPILSDFLENRGTRIPNTLSVPNQ